MESTRESAEDVGSRSERRLAQVASPETLKTDRTGAWRAILGHLPCLSLPPAHEESLDSAVRRHVRLCEAWERAKGEWVPSPSPKPSRPKRLRPRYFHPERWWQRQSPEAKESNISRLHEGLAGALKTRRLPLIHPHIIGVIGAEAAYKLFGGKARDVILLENRAKPERQHQYYLRNKNRCAAREKLKPPKSPDSIARGLKSWKTRQARYGGEGVDVTRAKRLARKAVRSRAWRLAHPQYWREWVMTHPRYRRLEKAEARARAKARVIASAAGGDGV